MSSLLIPIVPAVAAGALATAAMVAAEDAGLPVGAPEATMGLVVLMLVRELIKDRREKRADAAEKTAPDQRLEVQREISTNMAKVAGILAGMDADQRAILQITRQYQATGICPWTDPMRRHATIGDIGEVVVQRAPSASEIAEEVAGRVPTVDAIADEVRSRMRDEDR